MTPYAILKWNTVVCHCDAHKKEVRRHLEKIAGVKINGKINIANGEGEVTMNIESTVDLLTVIKAFPIKDEKIKNVKLFLKKRESGQTPCVILKWNTVVCHCDAHKKEVRRHLENIGMEINGEINIANGEGEVTMNIKSTVDLYMVIKGFPIKDEKRKNVKLFLKGRRQQDGKRKTPCVILKWNTSDQKQAVTVRRHLENIGGVKINGEINIANGEGKVIMNIWYTIDVHKVIKEFPITDEKRKNVTLFLKEN